ncbi:SpoIIE family protein phosphatase [Streptomyces echinoruber]|uniref:SpoIIE family protein phosphatase n=1 Tax=Streptomyces echinoruber TaxID=68898 RepID=UPI001E536BE8
MPTRKIDAAPGPLVLLVTNGLIERRHEDLQHSLRTLAVVTAEAPAAPEEACAHLLDHLIPDGSDNVTLVVVRLNAVHPDRPAPPPLAGGTSGAGRIRPLWPGWGSPGMRAAHLAGGRCRPGRAARPPPRPRAPGTSGEAVGPWAARARVWPGQPAGGPRRRRG